MPTSCAKTRHKMDPSRLVAHCGKQNCSISWELHTLPRNRIHFLLVAKYLNALIVDYELEHNV